LSDSTNKILESSIRFIQSRKAEDIKILDLRNASTFTDYFLICTGNSEVHVKAIADILLEKMKASGFSPLQVEGYNTKRWVLIDFVDIIIHIFLPETRSFYGLERLWGDVPIATASIIET